jgi:SAM-dependent methyltransferase
MSWTADALRSTLPALDLSARSGWHDTLEARKREERDFHNSSKASRERDDLPAETFETLHGNKKFYSVVGSSRAYLAAWLDQHVPGRVFLDYACGNGDQAIAAARRGAALAIGIDLSDVSIANARRQAALEGVADRCVFLVADCEQTGLPSGSVDVALCSGMLHHVDLRHAFPELQRVLTPGGRALAVESLDHNPLFKLYRLLTPAMRTEWEKRHILRVTDLRQAARFFDVRDVRYWHLFSLLAMVVRSKPTLFRAALAGLDCVDRLVLRLPGLRRLSWQFTFEMVKPRG